MNQRLRRHYDSKYAREAAAVSLGSVELRRVPTNRFEACRRLFPEYFRGGDILELAAGSGIVARSLLEAGIPIDHYTVSDLSEARLRGLKENLTDPRVRVVRLDCEDIPEEEFGRYDAVIMIAVIEHLIDPLRAMQRVRRLLRPGGFVYVDTPNIAKCTRRIKLLFGRFPSTASRDEGLTTYDGHPVDLVDEGHLHYFTFRSLSRMLTERCGFSRVEKLAYSVDRLGFGKRIENLLARLWPQMFSELALIAYAEAPSTGSAAASPPDG